jgi:hypothetical protein
MYIFATPTASSKTMTDTTTNPDLDQLIQIAAASIFTLRQIDVFRVLDTYPDKRGALANYIATVRVDLAAEVDEIMREEFGNDAWRESATAAI